MIDFLRNNYEWIAALLMALAAIITACSKFFNKKRGRSSKQKVGDISNSNVININGDYKNN